MTGPGYAALHGGEASAVLLPALGGKIRDVTLGGRQWLWHNLEVPFAIPPDGAPFDTTGDSGGFDDCFPTSAAGILPSWVRGAGDMPLVEHGDLWRCAPETAITTSDDGHVATCHWQGARWPWRFTRTVRVLPTSEVLFEYEAHNGSANAMPFLWAGHATFPLTEQTRLLLPEGARTRVWTQRGADFGGAGSEHHWPRVRSGAVMADMSRPWTALKTPYACRLYVSLPAAPCVIGIVEGTQTLEMHVDGREVPFVGLWLNREGWTPFAPKRSWLPWKRAARPYANLVVAPCLGAPDSLTDAVASWDSAAWLGPDDVARWTMTWRAGA